jgi:hypothetical protein
LVIAYKHCGAQHLLVTALPRENMG